MYDTVARTGIGGSSPGERGLDPVLLGKGHQRFLEHLERRANQTGATKSCSRAVVKVRAGRFVHRFERQLFEARPDKRYSFTDCTSFVLLHRLGKPAVAALDDPFRQEGFEVEVG